MLDKLASIAQKYLDLQQQLYDPAVAANPKRAMQVNREMSGLKETYELYTFIKQYTDQANEAKEMIESETDQEIIEMAKSELEEANTQLE